MSSTIHAVAGDAEGYQLALGALTGAGMFVGTCVAGSVMVVADGAKAKGALIRDVTAYLLATAAVGPVLRGIKASRQIHFETFNDVASTRVEERTREVVSCNNEPNQSEPFEDASGPPLSAAVLGPGSGP